LEPTFASDLKKIISILLVIIVIGQTFMNVGICIYYHLNKEYISKQLCENRNNPGIHCNGHCYLAKQLQRAEERDGKQSSQVIKEKEEIIFNQSSGSLIKYFPSYKISEFSSFNSSLYHSGYAGFLLRPPAA